MKQIISLIFLFSGFSIVAMNDDAIVTQGNEEEISYSLIISLFDRYMEKAMYLTQDKQEFMFSDYESPMFLYSVGIPLINNIVDEVSKTLPDGLSEEDHKMMKILVNKLKADPFNLKKAETTNIQTVKMYNFLNGKDLEKFDEKTKKRIMESREKYQAAWKTENAQVIQEAIENCQLFTSEKPYFSLSEQIITFKKEKLKK
jgi:hypothetical protein